MIQNDPKTHQTYHPKLAKSNFSPLFLHFSPQTVGTRPVLQGLPASPGAAMGKVVFCADEASFRNDVVKGIEDHLKHPKTEGFVSLSYTHIYVYI